MLPPSSDLPGTLSPSVGLCRKRHFATEADKPSARRVKPLTGTHTAAAEGCVGSTRRLPIWSCTRWGLPCRFCHQNRGALLPHHCTLTCRQRRHRRYVFCGTFPRRRLKLDDGWALPTTVPCGVRTFLPAFAERPPGHSCKDYVTNRGRQMPAGCMLGCTGLPARKQHVLRSQ